MAKKIIKPKKFSQYDFVNDISPKNRPTLYKPVTYLEFSPAYKQATNMKGHELGNVTAYIGGSDTGKTTSLMEDIKLCINDPNNKQLAVIIDKEGKFNYGRAKIMGLDITPIKYDIETGEELAKLGDDNYHEIEGDNVGVMYDKPFIVADDIFMREFLENNKSSLKGKEFKDKDYLKIGSEINADDVFNFMGLFIEKFNKSHKKYDFKGIFFMLDSYGRLHTSNHYSSLDDNKQTENRAEVQMINKHLGNFIEKYVKPSKSAYFPYFVTFSYIANKYEYRATANSQPTIRVEGGNKRKHITDIEFYLGGKLGSGIKSETRTYSGKTYAPFKLVDIEVMKNHGVIDPSSKDPVFITHHKGQLCNTREGMLLNTKQSKDEYWENLKKSGDLKSTPIINSDNENTSK